MQAYQVSRKEGAGWENASGKVDVFLKVVDQILEALENQVVPYNHIVAIACQGIMEQKCSSCHSEIKVTRIHFHGVPNNDPVVLLSPMHYRLRLIESVH